jgi:rod shape-determining protein MreD
MTFGRALACILCGHLAFLTLGALFGLSPWHIPVPEVALLTAVYSGLYGRNGVGAQVLIGVVAGYLVDLAAGAPTGLHMFSIGAIGLGAHLLAPRLLIASVWQLFVVLYLAACAHGFVVVGLGASQLGAEGLSELVLVPEHALLTSLLGPLIFALYRRIDQKPPARLQSAW